MKNNFKNIVDDVEQITKISNEIEKELLVASVKNKELVSTKEKVEKLRDTIVNALTDIINSDIIDMEIAILFENSIYLGVIKGQYVIYKKIKGNDNIDILDSSKKLQKALEYFYHHAYGVKKNKIKKN